LAVLFIATTTQISGDAKAKASDFANYFCSYAQLYHQKQMLQDHNRMAAYHSAILGNADVFKDKVVMDIGTGSGILAVWAAQAGAKKVYAIEYTDMAKYAQQVVDANNVQDIVTVLQCAVEDVVLPIQQDQLEVEEGDDDSTERCVDIIVSEWMGYFLLRESMLDSVIRARDKFLKRRTGLMMPSHCHMYVAPVVDEEERKHCSNEYASAMSDWHDFEQTTGQVYGVNMSVLEPDYDREQREYYLLSSRWTELPPESVLAEPKEIKYMDLMACTLAEARGVGPGEATFDFDIVGAETRGPISALAGWFTCDFKSRTDSGAVAGVTPRIDYPAFLSTGPENGYTHWGQQTFYFLNSVPIMKDETVRLTGSLEMMRTKENSRLYNCRISYASSRRKSPEDRETGRYLVQGTPVDQVYQIP
jgi:type I protein arginine methyltransferase